FHGNAGNLSHRGENVRRWQQETGLAVLIVDYPGYGKSAGKPSEVGCYAAGDAAYNWVTEKQKVTGQNVILYGRSLGGAIATELATGRKAGAVVLVSGFRPLSDMAGAAFAWVPGGGWLVRKCMDNVKKLAACRVPVFIAPGPAGRGVPFRQGEWLYAAAP